VWKHSKFRGKKLLVLLALAEWANDQGVCWPSLPMIAEKARITERGAARIVQCFVAMGVLEILQGGVGSGNVRRYQIYGEAGRWMVPAASKKDDRKSGFQNEKGDFHDNKKVTLEAQKGDRDDSAIRKNRHEPSKEQPSFSENAGNAASFARAVRERLELPSDMLLYRVISDALTLLMKRNKQPIETCAEYLVSRGHLWRASPDYARAPGNRWVTFFVGQHYDDNPDIWQRVGGANDYRSERDRKLAAVREQLAQRERQARGQVDSSA
jgi:hypothetical protein